MKSAPNAGTAALRVSAPVVEMPKIAPSKPAEAPATIPAGDDGAKLSGPDLGAATDVQRELRLLSLDGQLANLQDLAQSKAVNNLDPKQQAEVERRLQALKIETQSQIGQLDNPPPAMELGEIEFTDDVPVSQTLANGEVASLVTTTTPEGNWQVKVSVTHTYSGGIVSSSSATVTATPGTATAINLNNNLIKFTPKLATVAPPATSSSPPPVK